MLAAAVSQPLLAPCYAAMGVALLLYLFMLRLLRLLRLLLRGVSCGNYITCVRVAARCSSTMAVCVPVAFCRSCSRTSAEHAALCCTALCRAMMRRPVQGCLVLRCLTAQHCLAICLGGFYCRVVQCSAAAAKAPFKGASSRRRSGWMVCREQAYVQVCCVLCASSYGSFGRCRPVYCILLFCFQRLLTLRAAICRPSTGNGRNTQHSTPNTPLPTACPEKYRQCYCTWL